jgi:hypothetical protein
VNLRRDHYLSPLKAIKDAKVSYGIRLTISQEWGWQFLLSRTDPVVSKDARPTALSQDSSGPRVLDAACKSVREVKPLVSA